MELRAIQQVKEQHDWTLLAKKNVVAVGVGFKSVSGVETGELSIIVSVAEKVPTAQLAPRDLVPQALDGIPTDVQETGIIRALQARTGRHRPAPGGVSIGHVAITAGTLGCLVYRGAQPFILSNNHVLAAVNAGRAGDAILQPGPIDGGTSSDRIATLEAYVPLRFGTAEPTCPTASRIATFLNVMSAVLGMRHRFQAYQVDTQPNVVDAAIARPLSSDLVTARILEIGQPQGAGEATLGMRVRKSGRTTGLTSGQITQVAVTTQVSYGSAGTAVFRDQLITSPMSQGGDSGSAVLDENERVVGLLFAGSSVSTVVNRIQPVLSALQVSIRPG